MLRRLFGSLGLGTALLFSACPTSAIDDIGLTNRVWLQGTSETVSRGFQNAGTLLFETIDDAYNISLYVPDGAITNLATGLIQFEPGAGGARFLLADIINEGTFDTSYGLYLAKTNGVFHQRNLLNIATNVPFLYYCTNGYFFQESGSLTITGRFELNFATFVYSAGSITGTPRLINAALQLLPSATNSATFQINGTISQLLGDVPPGQTVRVLGSDTDGPGYLTSTNGFRNEGVIYLDATNAPYDAQLIILAGAVTNSTNGVICSRAGPGGNREIRGEFVNFGQLTNETALAITAPGNGFVNAGVVHLTKDQFLTINSDFKQTAAGTLKLELSQPDPGFDVEFMTVTNTAQLDGQLELVLADGYTPLLNDSFRVVSCKRRTGYLSLSRVPILPPGLAWKVDYRNDAVIVSVGRNIQPPVVEEFARATGGGIQLVWTGTPSGALVVQSSADLKSWSSVVTNRPFEGLFEFTDNNASRASKRFFRAVAVP